MNKFVKFICFLVVFCVCLVGISAFAKRVYPVKHRDIVEKYADEYAVSKNMIYSIIKAESNFESKAVSSKYARGLMQIMVPTAEWVAGKLGITDFSSEMLADPEINIEMGCFYISYLLKMYNGNKKCAVSAYNAGYKNVDLWLSSKKYSHDGKTLDVIPYPETEKYVNLVMQNERIYNFLYN